MGIRSGPWGAAFLVLASFFAGSARAIGPTATEWEDAAGTFTKGINGVSLDVVSPVSSTLNLNSVHGRSRVDLGGGAVVTNEVYAVGDMGTIIRYDGTQWSVVASPVGDVNLYDVYILPSPDSNGNLGWAVGERGTILRMDSGGAWSVYNHPSAPCVIGGNPIPICATLYDIFPADENDPDSWLVIAGHTQCAPPDPGPAPAFGMNPGLLMFDPGANAWSRVVTGGPPFPYDLNLSSGAANYGCSNSFPFTKTVAFTGLVTSTGAAPTAGGIFDTSSLSQHTNLSVSTWEFSGITCTAATDNVKFNAARNVGSYGIIAGDLDTAKGCASPTGKNPVANLYAVSANSVPQPLSTGLSAATYGDLRGFDFSEAWGFGIGVGEGSSPNTAYFARLQWPNLTRLPQPEDATSGNTVTYQQTPSLSWNRLNGAFIVAASEAWAVGDNGQIYHWSIPPPPPAALTPSLSGGRKNDWVRVVMDVTNTGGSPASGISTTLNPVPGIATAICGPVCGTVYCVPTPPCPTSLLPGGTASFTWSYTLTGYAPAWFTGTATGTDLITAAPVSGSDAFRFGDWARTSVAVTAYKTSCGYDFDVMLTFTNTGVPGVGTGIISVVPQPNLSVVPPGAVKVGGPLPGGTAGPILLNNSWTETYRYSMTGGAPPFTFDGCFSLERQIQGDIFTSCGSGTTSTVLPGPPLTVSVLKTQTPSNPAPGTGVTYEIVVTNSGTVTVTGLTVTDTVATMISVPLGLAGTEQPAPFAIPSRTSVPGGTRYLWTSPAITLYPGASLTFTVNGTVGTVCSTTTAVNRAAVGATDGCTATAFVSNATAVTQIVQIPNLAVSTAQLPAVPGINDAVSYRVVVSNTGGATLQNLTVTDTFPALLSGTATTEPAAFAAALSTVGPNAHAMWTSAAANFRPGTSLTFTVTGILNEPCASARLAATAYAESAAGCGFAPRDSAASTPVTIAPTTTAVNVWKTQAPAVPVAGDVVTYRIVVTNTGSATLIGLTVIDTLPAPLTVTSASQPGAFTRSDVGNVRRWTGASPLVPAASFTFTVTGSIGAVSTPLLVGNTAYAEATSVCAFATASGSSTPFTLNPPLASSISVNAVQTGPATFFNTAVLTVTNTGLIDITQISPGPLTVGGGYTALSGPAPSYFAGPLSPGTDQDFTWTYLTSSTLMATTACATGTIFGTSATAQTCAGDFPRSTVPAMTSQMAVSALQSGPGSYFFTAIMTVTNTGGVPLVQLLPVDTSAPAPGFSRLSGPTPGYVPGPLSAGGVQAFTWTFAANSLTQTVSACVSATLFGPNIPAQVCASGQPTLAAPALTGTTTLTVYEGCGWGFPSPCSSTTYFAWTSTASGVHVVSVDLAVTNRGLVDAYNVTPSAVFPAGMSLLAGPQPASLPGPLAPGGSVTFGWDVATVNPLPVSLTLDVTAVQTTSATVYASLNVTTADEGNTVASSSLSVNRIFEPNIGLSGRWRIEVTQTLTNLSGIDLSDVCSSMYAWSDKPDRIWRCRDVQCNPDITIPRANPSIVQLTPTSAVLRWGFSTTGGAKFFFSSAMCGETVPNARGTVLPLFTTTTTGTEAEIRGTPGTFALNRNLMRGLEAFDAFRRGDCNLANGSSTNKCATASFNLKEDGPASLKVYNAIGQRVRTLFEQFALARQDYDAVWDGTNDDGEPVASGIYYFRLESKRYVQIRKLAVIK